MFNLTHALLGRTLETPFFFPMPTDKIVQHEDIA
jgi:hypothetical protein